MNDSSTTKTRRNAGKAALAATKTWQSESIPIDQIRESAKSLGAKKSNMIAIKSPWDGVSMFAFPGTNGWLLVVTRGDTGSLIPLESEPTDVWRHTGYADGGWAWQAMGQGLEMIIQHVHRTEHVDGIGTLGGFMCLARKGIPVSLVSHERINESELSDLQPPGKNYVAPVFSRSSH